MHGLLCKMETMVGWRSCNDITSGSRGLGFDSQAGQIRHVSPTAHHRCEICLMFEAVLLRR